MKKQLFFITLFIMTQNIVSADSIHSSPLEMHDQWPSPINQCSDGRMCPPPITRTPCESPLPIHKTESPVATEIPKQRFIPIQLISTQLPQDEKTSNKTPIPMHSNEKITSNNPVFVRFLTSPISVKTKPQSRSCC